jgi:hypothetical protein
VISNDKEPISGDDTHPHGVDGKGKIDRPMARFQHAAFRFIGTNSEESFDPKHLSSKGKTYGKAHTHGPLSGENMMQRSIVHANG